MGKPSLDAVLAMRRRRAQGATIETVANQFNISVGKCYYYLETAELPAEQGKPQPVVPRNVDQVKERRKQVTRLAEALERGEPKYSSASAIAAELQRGSRIVASKSTVHRDLVALGFKSRARKKTCLQAREKAKRVAFARKYLDKRLRLVFSDEKVFTTNNDSYNRQWVRGNRRTVRRAQHRWPSARIMVWGAIGVGFNKLVVLPAARGRVAADAERALPYRMNQDAYIKLCLRPVLNQLNGKIFQQDGAAVHTARRVTALLQENNVALASSWPAHSPDMSPIETLWANMQRLVTRRRPQTRKQLIYAVRKAWTDLGQAAFDRHVMDWRRRAQLVIDNDGAEVD